MSQGVLALCVIAGAYVLVTIAEMISKAVSDRRNKRHQAEVLDQQYRIRVRELEGQERQLKMLPEVIGVYANVTGDQAKADELSALLQGLIRGNAPSSDPVLYEKLDEIRECLEALERDEDDDQRDEDESWFSLQIHIEKEKTARVEALFSHLQATHTHPIPAQLEGLILAAQGSKAEPPVPARNSGVRVDPRAAAPTADSAQTSDEPVAANAANDDAQRDGTSPG